MDFSHPGRHFGIHFDFLSQVEGIFTFRKRICSGRNVASTLEHCLRHSHSHPVHAKHSLKQNITKRRYPTHSPIEIHNLQHPSKQLENER